MYTGLQIFGLLQDKQGVLQQNLNKYYHFKEANKVCEEFNKMVEVIKEEEGKSKEKYPWLDDTDERKYMTDKEILEKYIDLKDSCLDDSERKQFMKMLYDYKDVLSLKDEIGTCLSIEVNIEVTDNSLFFIRPFHVKEEDRAVLHMPDNIGRFQLYSDTSKIAMGSALYQIQNGKLS